MELIFITGTAGAGKSLLASSLLSWYKEKGQDAISVNLDPGATSLPYNPDVDIRTKINFEDLMNELSLGPNGALVLATDLTASKVSEVQEEIDSTNPDFVIVDTPGQIELFVFRESGPFIGRNLSGDSKSLLFLFDSLVASSPTNFLSLALLATSVKLRMGLPQIHVLSKTDLAPEAVASTMKWSRESASFEEALSKARSGEEYTFYSQLFRSLRRVSLSAGLCPVSSFTRDGLVALIGEISRVARGGEELAD
jgi:GPN-loop GTPase